MRAETRSDPGRFARREEHLTRMSQRMEYEPQYADLYDDRGQRVSAKYLGHKRVLNRGIHHIPKYFEFLSSSISHIDLSKASEDSQYVWRHVK